ncbi:hypothetical protein DFQ07_1847 [Tenacibaculum caenipelagi]|uniref:Uncharacterized protein n=1 Tax=Tenacibaculum caenipelagi TaxID=1325435 RepID=A0A4R6TE98_9FLAO|nr:hypothetical protein DFQ07_1847 [Tenacibaculum caenipelagi]
MAWKVVNLSFELLNKFGASLQEIALKTATNHTRKTLPNKLKNKNHLLLFPHKREFLYYKISKDNLLE